MVPGGWRREIQVAVAAARWAGVLLRDEANRAEGPRGWGGHAEVDDEVERGIRSHLMGAFPHDGWLGEETREERILGASGRIWIVDPNDGTREFLKGYRGPAISIALVEKGVPVLGVVYAYNHPDDRGDLLVGVVEDGLVLRNGVKITRTWPQTLSDEVILLMAPGAERSPLANLECIHPARFRTMPSVAYRLALAAVDEGDVGFALAGPVAWDVAGGHALILAAGGDLFGKDGVPLRYDSMGEFPRQSIMFGGGIALAGLLGSRDWGSVRRIEKDKGPIGLCFPLRHRKAIEPDILARAQGCLLGQLAGDTLGGQVEGRPHEEVRQRYPHGVRDLADGGRWGTLAGQPTDDSEMALALARTLIAEGSFRADAVAAAYRTWLDSSPFDVGKTIESALRGIPRPNSQSNGALMRISPLGILGAFRDPQDVVRWAEEDAALTHEHPLCGEASGLFARAIAHGIRYGGTGQDLFEHMARWSDEMKLSPGILDLFSAAVREENPLEDTRKGWVLVALRNALWQLYHASSLEEALLDTVMRGGDTDTNGAICGALLGAVYGRCAIPLRWQRRILSCRPLKGLCGVFRPREDLFWPVDALILSERLLLAGENQNSLN